MKIEASKRLMAQDGEWVDAAPVVERIQNHIQRLFPKSYVEVGIVKSLGSFQLDINFTLGAGPQDYINGTSHNDVARNFWTIYNVVSEDGTKLRANARYRVETDLSFQIPPTKPREVYPKTVRVARAFSSPNLTAFIKKVEGDYTKLAQTMKKYVDEISQEQGKDMSSYLR